MHACVCACVNDKVADEGLQKTLSGHKDNMDVSQYISVKEGIIFKNSLLGSGHSTNQTAHLHSQQNLPNTVARKIQNSLRKIEHKFNIAGPLFDRQTLD